MAEGLLKPNTAPEIQAKTSTQHLQSTRAELSFILIFLQTLYLSQLFSPRHCSSTVELRVVSSMPKQHQPTFA